MAVYFLVALAVLVLASAEALPSGQSSTAAPDETNLYETLKTGNQECLDRNNFIICIGTCTAYSTLGILEKDGQYVESKLVDFVATARKLNQEEKTRAASACHNVTTTSESTQTGCERARRVFRCLADYKLKEPTFFEMLLATSQLCHEKYQYFICSTTLCLSLKMIGVIDTNDHYVGSKLIEYMVNSAGVTQEEADQVTTTCDTGHTVNGTETGCERAHKVLRCINDQKIKVTADQSKL